MKDPFSKTSTTSIIAVMLTGGTLGYCFVAHLIPSKGSETTDTQVLQGLFGALLFMLGYYFGTMKNRPASSGPAINNAEEVNVTNNLPVDGENPGA